MNHFLPEEPSPWYNFFEGIDLMRKLRNKRVFFSFIIILLSILIVAGAFLSQLPSMWARDIFTAADFNIKTLISNIDKDRDGIDDYTDILLGARSYIESNPEYDDEYCQGGYPEDGKGVCTDVIWSAFKSAGYNLKDLVDEDIAKNPSRYSEITKPDPNIDFRRVPNLFAFFQKYAESVTLNTDEIEAWQPGDIVIFPAHIAIISDKRNKTGRTYIIHHTPGGAAEQDALSWEKPIGHFRWN